MPPTTILHHLSFHFDEQIQFPVIVSEHSESKDLRTDFTILVILVPRSLDFIPFRSG